MAFGSIKEIYAYAGDGTRLRYVKWSGPKEVGVILIHSLAMDSSFWAPVAAKLAHVSPLIAVDCRGHGLSDKPDTPYSVETFAEDLLAVLDDAGWEKAVVAGASMGGCVALAFAAAHADRCAGLGLFDTTSWYGPKAPAQWDERAQKALDNGMSSLVEFQKTRWFSDAFRQEHPEIVDSCVATFLRNDVAAYARTCRMLGAVDLRSALPGITIPTRIAVGEEDYATPPVMAEAMLADISNAKLHVISGGRHFTPLERPDLIAEELKKLVEEAQP